MVKNCPKENKSYNKYMREEKKSVYIYWMNKWIDIIPIWITAKANGKKKHNNNKNNDNKAKAISPNIGIRTKFLLKLINNNNIYI